MTSAGDFGRLDELDQAIEWGLSHGPTNFYNIEGDFLPLENGEDLRELSAIKDHLSLLPDRKPCVPYCVSPRNYIVDKPSAAM